MTKTRFSKKWLLDKLNTEIDRYETGEHRFHSRSGYDQVKHKDMSVIVEYGKYAKLVDLLEELS